MVYKKAIYIYVIFAFTSCNINSMSKEFADFMKDDNRESFDLGGSVRITMPASLTNLPDRLEAGFNHSSQTVREAFEKSREAVSDGFTKSTDAVKAEIKNVGATLQNNILGTFPKTLSLYSISLLGAWYGFSMLYSGDNIKGSAVIFCSLCGLLKGDKIAAYFSQ